MGFEEIYESYFKDVYLYIRSMSVDPNTAEEIAQETFAKALKAIERFDGSKDIRAWLFTIAKNTYLTYCRKKHIPLPEDYQLEEDMGKVSGVSLVQHLANEEDAIAIHHFLHAMKEPYKEVFSLRVFGELSFSVIGNLFGKSESWARVTFHRARKKIMEYMEEVRDERD